MAVATSRGLLNPNISLSHAGLDDGMKYADFGSGRLGHFVFPAAEIVGEDGKVYAVDIIKSVLQSIRSHAQDASIHHVEEIWGDVEREGGVKIPPHLLDLVSIVNMGRQLKKSDTPIREAKRLLKPRGKLLVVSWKPSGEFLAAKDDMMDSERLEHEVQNLGFACIDRFDAGAHHWGRVFELLA